MTDTWRDLEWQRVHSGVPVAVPRWTCTHNRGLRQLESPNKCRVPSDAQRRYLAAPIVPIRDHQTGRWSRESA